MRGFPLTRSMSPDGRWAYAVHALGRFNLPITQLERGWVHTYALSIVDLAAAKILATVLLDDLTGGSADPWAVVVSADGRRLWISHAGTHEVSTVEIAKVHELLDGKIPEALARLKDGGRDNVWVRIAQDKKLMPQLANDLTALYLAGAIRRSPSGGNGPRGLALAPDGGKLYAANYFSGTIGVLETETGKPSGTIPLGPQPAADPARRGEIYFHDATRCFQSWHSCASCHPEGRVDGLPWDFMRDGIGNAKDVISLVGIAETSPHNRRATRADPRECMQTGVIGSHLVVPEPSDVEDLLAYVTALVPEPNPLAPQLAEAARRGKALFEGKANCAVCHPAPWYTDRKVHNAGILTPSEPDGKYDTPSLVEAYRTAPYFHDGRAATLKDALTRHDSDGKHGHAKDLTPQELGDLIAFLLSL
jgi:YVTN family beta-propeller protein